MATPRSAYSTTPHLHQRGTPFCRNRLGDNSVCDVLLSKRSCCHCCCSSALNVKWLLAAAAAATTMTSTAATSLSREWIHVLSAWITLLACGVKEWYWLALFTSLELFPESAWHQLGGWSFGLCSGLAWIGVRLMLFGCWSFQAHTLIHSFTYTQRKL